MRWSGFETRVPGKWVLAGEHSVLRGGTAVTLPHPEFSLKLKFSPGGSGLRVSPETAKSVILDLLEAVSDYWESQGRSFVRPEGELSIESSIPVGAGLGSSAALSVAMSRWLGEPLRHTPAEVLSFATQLEHRFHGRSSGMDVAAVSTGEPMSFEMNQGPRLLRIRKIPHFTFHDTGLRSRTSECVVRLEKLREDSPVFGMKIDEQMGAATRLCIEGLNSFDAGLTEQGLNQLARGMNQAQECFYEWQLVPSEGRHLVENLLKNGALAAKLTGAGGGGIIVALWQNEGYAQTALRAEVK